MIDKYYKDFFVLPLHDFGITKGFDKAKHKGIDFGYVKVPNCDLYPIQEGEVVDKFYSQECGYGVVIQHNYSDGSHRWSGYIHMQGHSPCKIGDKVFPRSSANPTKIGKRGNSGQKADGTKYGVHLHMYVTEATTKAYDWDLVRQSSSKSLCTFDYKSQLYRTNKETYIGVTTPDFPVFEDIPEPIVYPKPVERNSKIKQCEVLIDYLRLRSEPSGEIYDQFAQMGIYSVLSEKVSGSYNWYQIAEINGRSFWIASGGTRTKDLPVDDDPVEELKKEIADLTAKLDQITNEKNELDSKLNKIGDIINE